MVPTGWLVDPPWGYCGRGSVVEYAGYWRPETGKGWPGPINELKEYQIKRYQYSRTPSILAGTGGEVKPDKPSTGDLWSIEGAEQSQVNESEGTGRYNSTHAVGWCQVRR